MTFEEIKDGFPEFDGNTAAIEPMSRWVEKSKTGLTATDRRRPSLQFTERGNGPEGSGRQNNIVCHLFHTSQAIHLSRPQGSVFFFFFPNRNLVDMHFRHTICSLRITQLSWTVHGLLIPTAPEQRRGTMDQHRGIMGRRPTWLVVLLSRGSKPPEVCHSSIAAVG